MAAPHPASSCPPPPPPCSFKAHVVPFNSGLLAREVLCHPFFGAGEVQHASVPWKVRATWPHLP